MERNVFISFLGTTNYKQVEYQWSDGLVSPPVRFIQEAILMRKAIDWTENDRIFIFYTEESKRKNWENDGQINDKYKIKEIEKIGLKERLEGLNLKAKIEPHEIKEGFSEKEVWSIFETVYGVLKTGDRIYFDITHAFRSIPLFASSLFNFSQYLLDTQIISVNYGAYEKLLSNKNSKYAPIVDMTNIVRLQKLTETATSITEFGRIKKLSEAIKNSGSSDNVSSFIQNISNAITTLDEAIQTCRISDLKKGKNIKLFRESLKKLNNSQKAMPIKILAQKVNAVLSDFVDYDSYKNVEAAINWTRKHEMLSQAATLSQEYIITYTTEILRNNGINNPYVPIGKTDNQKYFKKYRQFIGSILGISNEDVSDQHFEGKLLDYPDKVDEILTIPYIIEIRMHYDTLRKVRNSLNHGKGDTTYDKIKEEFDISYTKCLEVMHKQLIDNKNTF